MPKRALTAAAVERIKPPATGQADHFDAGYPGLALRISYGGSRTWVYFYRLHGKQVRMTLGRHPSMSLAKARAAWQGVRQAVGKGESPKNIKPVAANNFEAVAEEWLKRDQAHNRSVAEVKRVLERDIKPAWSGRQISTLQRRDVIELIDSIADRGTVVMARRVHAHLHRLFRWSVGRGIVELNPMADLPKPGVAPVARDRVLSDSELAIVWQAADAIGWPFGPAIRLLIVTAARRDEVGALRWTEVEADRIALNGSRTKNGEPHNIPLSRTAADIIAALPRVADSPFVFSTTKRTPISGWSKAKTTIDAEAAKINGGRPLPSWRLHDLRRSAATGLQRLGVGLQTTEAVLGHISGSRSGIVGVYQRHDYADEKRAALDAWSRHVIALVNGTVATVVRFRSSRGRP